jgi:DNA-binding PadR family transcriptional regulator
MTLQRALILRGMLEAPFADWYGLELARGAGLKSGTIYPALAALERSGLLSSSWESVDPAVEGRPRRRLYRLVPDRLPEAQQYVAHFDAALAPSRPKRGTARVTPEVRPA